MYEWKLEEIRAGVEEYFRYLPATVATINKFIYETTDTHVLDIFGTSEAEDKVKCNKFWTIAVEKDNKFTVTETKLLWGGEFVEREVYAPTRPVSDEAYADAIRGMKEKSDVYIASLPKIFRHSYASHSYVIVEKREDGVPVVKWVTVGYAYYAESATCEGKKTVERIEDLVLEFQDKDCDAYDIYSMAMYPVNYLCEDICLTKLHVDVELTYELYDGKKNSVHIDEVYENHGEFSQAMRKLDDEIEYAQLESKWHVLAGIDIKAMNKLASFLAVEAYFAKGLNAIRGKAEGPLPRKGGETDIEYLNRQESYEDFLEVLCGILQGLEKNVIRDAFAYLKDHADEDPLEIVHKFVKPHLSRDYEVGKVYFARVKIESLKSCNAERDALVELFDAQSQYRFMEKFLYDDYVLKYADLHDYSWAFKAEHLDIHAWGGTTTMDAYLKDNLYLSEEGLRPHGWENEIIPVKLVGFRADNMPIVEHMQEWHF